MLSAARRSLIVITVIGACLSILSARTVADAADDELLGSLRDRLDPVDDVALVDVVAPATPRTDLRVRIEGPSGAETLRLSRVSVRAPRFRVRTPGPEGTLVERPTSAPSTWRGHIVGRPDITVAASLTSRGLTAAIMEPGAPDRYLQPVHRLLPEAPVDDAVHVLYTRSTSRIDETTCGADALPPPLNPYQRDGAGAPGGSIDNLSCMRLGQIAFDVDYEYYQRAGSLEQAVADVEATINAMAPIYARDIMVQHEITEIIVRTEEPDPYSTWDPYELLDQFQYEWNTNQGGVPRHMTHLITGREVSGNIIGLAYVGVVCNTPWAYGWSQYTYDFGGNVGIARHELGHNWGAGHCHDAMCDIMCGNCLDRFSPTTIRVMLGYRNAVGCLGDPGPWPEPIAPRAFPNGGHTLASEAIAIDVLEDAHDANCDDLDIGQFDATTPNGGRITLLPGGGQGGRDALLYTPDSGFEGTDTFHFDIIDPFGLTDTETVSVEVLQLREPDEPLYAVSGLFGAYYQLGPRITTLPDFGELDPYLIDLHSDLNYGASSGPFARSGLSDYVGAVFTGFIDVPTDGVYTMYTTSNDGSALYIDGRRVVDNDGVHGMREVAGYAGFRAGLHEVRVEFFESTGDAGLIVSMEGPGFPKQVISEDRWFREPDMTLLVFPLRAGRTSDVFATDAPPGKRVYLTYSLAGEGSTFVPALNVTLDLLRPKLAGSDVADGGGTALIRVTPPPGSELTLVWFQGAVYGLTSDVALEQIN